MVTRRSLLGVVASAGAVAAIAACAPAATPAPAEAKPKNKATWNVAVNFILPSIDIIASQEGSTGILAHFYESLTDTQGTDFQLVGRLAERWERRDPTTTRFFLRKGVQFHNGKEFKAADVKWSYEQVYANPVHFHNRYALWLARVDVIDDYTVDIVTKTPNNLTFLYDMSQLFIGSEAMRAEEVRTDKAIGTGPYMVDSWDKVTLKLKAFPSYWRGKPQPENVNIRSIQDSTTAAAELTTGGVDLVRDVDLIQAASLAKNEQLEMLAFKGGTVDAMYPSLLKSPLGDKRVRQAMNYAVNRQEITEKVMLGFATPLAGPWSRGFGGYDPNLKPYAYDPQKAKSLLAEAGYANGFKGQWGLALNTLSGAIFKQAHDAISSQLRAVGIDLEVVPFTTPVLSGAAWCSAPPPGNSHLVSGTWGVAADPVAFLTYYVGTRPCQQVPAVMRAIDAANAAADLDKRRTALQEVARVWHDEGIFLSVMAHDFVVGRRKEGVNYQISPAGNSNAMHQWFDVSSVKPLVASK